MIHQYLAQRFQYLQTTRRGLMPVGTIPVGAIVRPHNCTSNVEVLAWLPRESFTYRDRKAHKCFVTGGHLALVRNLRDGKVFPLSDVWLLDAPEM